MSLYFITFPNEGPDERDAPTVKDCAVSDSEDEAYLKLMEQNDWLKSFWMYPGEHPDRGIRRLSLRTKNTYDKLSPEDKLRVARNVLTGKGWWTSEIQHVPLEGIIC